MRPVPGIDQRLEFLEGHSVLSFFVAEKAPPLEPRRPSLLLAELEAKDLVVFGRVPKDRAHVAYERRGRSYLLNGWQSWSDAGEFLDGELQARGLVPAFRAMVERPGLPPRSSELQSHFTAAFRRERDWIILASVLPGGAPLCFRISPYDLSIKLEVYAEGARYEPGAPIARIALGSARDYFPAKDCLAGMFAPWRDFGRLAFLGHEGRLVPGGYESWYNHYTAIDEGVIGADLEALPSNGNLVNAYYLGRGKPTVFQIDDGWERKVGDWEADPAKFPSGMAAMAARIEAKGMVPGLWLAPFIVSGKSRTFAERPDWLLRDGAGRPVKAGWNPGWDGNFYALDLSKPEVEEALDALFERVVEDWGYRYLKIDFLYAGMLRGRRSGGGAAFEAYERVLGRLCARTEDRRGRPVAWLGCGAPLGSSWRQTPLMRVGADTKERWEWPLLKALRHEGRPAAFQNLRHTIGRTLLDGTVFVNDPDVFFCREKGMEYGEREKETVALVGFLLASQVMFSDDPADFGSPGERAFTERLVGLLDRLAGREYGAWRIGRDLYRITSRDNGAMGFVNLSDSPRAVRGYEAQRAAAGRPVVLRGAFRPRPTRWDRGAQELLLEPRSVSLFEVEDDMRDPE